MRIALSALAAIVLTAPLAAQPVTVEYIAHAAFVVHSPLGAAVAIDPYNSNRWLGYRYPDNVSADAVLVTHPHYDHDADYHFGPDTPVFRAPGEYSVGDIHILGVEGRHALNYGMEFGQRNTVWLIETGGVRILHVGDNGPLSSQALAAIGSADILMAPVDDLEHILSFAEIEEMIAQLGASVFIPMHYRLEPLSSLPKSVGPIRRWLADRSNVQRLRSNTVKIARRDLPSGTETWVLPPSPSVDAWTDSVSRAWELRDAARTEFKFDPASAKGVALLEEARSLAPDILVFAVELSEALSRADREPAAAKILEDALLRAARPDHEYAEKARLLLARLYHGQGRPQDADAQYRFLLNRTQRLDWRREAQQATER